MSDDPGGQSSLSIDAAISLVALVLLIGLNAIFRSLTQMGGELVEVITVPFDIILIAFTLFLGASFKGSGRQRDLSWAILMVGVVLVLFSGYVSASLEQGFWRAFLAHYLPDGIGVVVLFLAIFFASRD